MHRELGKARVFGPWARAFALSVVAIAAGASEQAQQQEEEKVGTFTFNRCAASKGSGASMLCIALGAERQHFMSVPGVEGSGRSPMRIRFDAGQAIVPHVADKNRASVELDYPTVDRFMGAKRLEVSFACNTYTWDLSGQSMEAILRAVSNCTGKPPRDNRA